jgi:hypothetical protein
MTEVFRELTETTLKSPPFAQVQLKAMMLQARSNNLMISVNCI